MTMIAAKAPKSKHYSESQSLEFRISSAICQKNLGVKYLIKVNACVGFSLGKVLGKKSEQASYKTRKLFQSTIEYIKKT